MAIKNYLKLVILIFTSCVFSSCNNSNYTPNDIQDTSIDCEFVLVSIEDRDSDFEDWDCLEDTSPIFSVLITSWGKLIDWRKKRTLNFKEFIHCLDSQKTKLVIFTGHPSCNTKTRLQKQLESANNYFIFPANSMLFSCYHPHIMPKCVNLLLIDSKKRTYSINGSTPGKIESNDSLKSKLNSLKGIIFVFQQDACRRPLASNYDGRRFDYAIYMTSINDYEFRKQQDYIYLQSEPDFNNKIRTTRILYTDGSDYFYFEKYLY